VAIEPTPELRARLRLPDDNTPYYRGTGCKQCFNSGHRGRVGLYEMLEVNPSFRRLLEQNVDPEQLRHQRKKSGETTLFEEGMLAAVAGQTSLEEVLRVAGAACGEE
jgi:type II secretory ATPase GspE/PulE/Tfp pilus assembly ATPase PilB-like protein